MRVRDIRYQMKRGGRASLDSKTQADMVAWQAKRLPDWTDTMIVSSIKQGTVTLPYSAPVLTIAGGSGKEWIVGKAGKRQVEPTAPKWYNHSKTSTTERVARMKAKIQSDRLNKWGNYK